MRWTRSLIPTLRQVPAEAVVPSHQLMLRAGLIQQVAAGSYTYLPLGAAVLRKVMQIVREEMNRADAVEVFMPTLQPVEWWEQTGRREAYGDNLFVVKDRHGRHQAMGPTHEEVCTKLFDAYVSSYRQLPLNLYQIQTKFRDEFRPRFGVLRSREFQMKDAYSFHLTLDGPGGLSETYDKMYDAYCRVFARCGVPYVVVEAEAGPIGGNASHEFMIPSPTGEDTVLASDKGNYAANVEKCEIGSREISVIFSGNIAPGMPGAKYVEDSPPTGELAEVHTPNASSIDDLCKGWSTFAGGKLKPSHTLKTLVFKAEGDLTTEEQATAHKLRKEYGFENDGFVFYWVAVVRGDHELNEAKLRQFLTSFHGREMSLKSDNIGLSLMDESEAKSAGFPIGYVGPHIVNDLTTGVAARTYVVIDPDATHSGFWVTGANAASQHVMHFNWERDYQPKEQFHRTQVADIRNATEGDPSPKDDGGVLRESKGIEVGHIFKLGDKYSQSLKVTVLDENQQEVHPLMGCYGIGINRIIAGAIERDGGNDDGGVVWPMSIAPFHVVITPIKYEGRAAEVANELYEKLQAEGLDVLLDDRAERPGVKFKDADLIGIPLRLTVGDKGLANDEVEFKPRTEEKAEMVKLEAIIERTTAFVREAM